MESRVQCLLKSFHFKLYFFRSSLKSLSTLLSPILKFLFFSFVLMDSETTFRYIFSFFLLFNVFYDVSLSSFVLFSTSLKITLLQLDVVKLPIKLFLIVEFAFLLFINNSGFFFRISNVI